LLTTMSLLHCQAAHSEVEMRKPRRAKLTICGLSESGWLRLTARNGEILLSGERVDKKASL
jgi:hypothetical protein